MATFTGIATTSHICPVCAGKSATRPMCPDLYARMCEEADAAAVALAHSPASLKVRAAQDAERAAAKVAAKRAAKVRRAEAKRRAQADREAAVVTIDWLADLEAYLKSVTR